MLKLRNLERAVTTSAFSGGVVQLETLAPCELLVAPAGGDDFCIALPAFETVSLRLGDCDAEVRGLHVVLAAQRRLGETDETSFTTLDPPSRRDIDPQVAKMFERSQMNFLRLQAELQALREPR